MSDPWPGYKGDRPTDPAPFDAPGAVDVATVRDIIEAVRTVQETRWAWERQHIDDQVALDATYHEYFVATEALLKLQLPDPEP